MVKHHKRPACRDIVNFAKLTPLTLASKLGRHKLFKDVLETNCIVSILVNYSSDKLYKNSSTISSFTKLTKSLP